MKFVTLISRGGNYMLATHNVAWLRTAENGQTQVGIVGGDSLMVSGSMEETAATIMAAQDQVA
jgi:periplasmic protein TonB